MQVDPYDESLGIVEMKIGQVKYNSYLLSTDSTKYYVFFVLAYRWTRTLNWKFWNLIQGYYDQSSKKSWTNSIYYTVINIEILK